MAYNFQTGSNRIKLLMEYECVTQLISLCIEPILQNATQLQHARLSWHVRCPSDDQFPSKCSPAFAVLTVSIAATLISFTSSREVTGGPVNNVLNVSSQEEVKRRNIGRARRSWNWSVTPNPPSRKMQVKKFSDNTSPVWGCTILLEQHIWLMIVQLR
jgi:hypothetical protein